MRPSWWHGPLGDGRSLLFPTGGSDWGGRYWSAMSVIMKSRVLCLWLGKFTIRIMLRWPISFVSSWLKSPHIIILVDWYLARRMSQVSMMYSTSMGWHTKPQLIEAVWQGWHWSAMQLIIFTWPIVPWGFQRSTARACTFCVQTSQDLLLVFQFWGSGKGRHFNGTLLWFDLPGFSKTNYVTVNHGHCVHNFTYFVA